MARRIDFQGQKALYAFRVSNCPLLPNTPIAKMSDYEDEMDVDAPPVKESIIFSSDNTNAKGKRSAANLPVEAEDNLPWYLELHIKKCRD